MKCHTKIQLIYSIIYLALIKDNSLLKISYLSKEFNHIGVTELFCNQPQNLETNRFDSGGADPEKRPLMLAK